MSRDKYPNISLPTRPLRQAARRYEIVSDVFEVFSKDI